jgi:hypothetical protein
MLQEHDRTHTFLLALRNLSGSNPSTVPCKRKDMFSVIKSCVTDSWNQLSHTVELNSCDHLSFPLVPKDVTGTIIILR